MTGAIAAGLFLAGIALFCLTVCHLIAWWSMRTPRSGYLILAVFALYVLIRTLP
jgi:hypothetical protein